MHNNPLVTIRSALHKSPGFRVAACGPRIKSGAGIARNDRRGGVVIPAKARIQNSITPPHGGASRLLAQSHGFTLFELILVIVIISIAAALVGPAIGSRLLQTNIRRTVLQLRSAVEVMRMQAVRSGQEAVMVVDPRDNAYWREGGGEPVALSPDNALLSARSRWLRENGQAEFHFYPDGTNSGGAIRIEQGRGSATAYLVVLDPLLGTASIVRDE